MSGTCSNVSTFECKESVGAADNNHDSVPSYLGGAGASYVTGRNPAQALYTIGPLRDTEFSLLGTKQLRRCRPGLQKQLRCSLAADGANSQQPQVLRVCESSIALNVGLACRYNDSLANEIIKAVEPRYETITFTCPDFRDVVEKGGRYSLYQAMVIVTDGTAKIKCVEVEDDEDLMDLFDAPEEYRTMKQTASSSSIKIAALAAFAAVVIQSAL